MKAFYDTIRGSIFDGSLSQQQVDGIRGIVKAFNLYGSGFLADLAYHLATTTWEVGKTMQPITERGQRSYFDKYEPGTRIGEKLGNTEPGDGYRYRGRGYVQLTGRRNYALASAKLGIDLINNPDLALQPDVAARILIIGMKEGWFTGKKLSDFIDDVDESDAEDEKEYFGGRKTVNGTDRAREIAQYALIYEKALRLVDFKNSEPGAPPTSTSAPSQTPGSSEPRGRASPWAGIVAALVKLIMGLFGKKP